MSISIAAAKESLLGQLHGGSLNKVRGIEALFERTANTLLSKIDPIDCIRISPLPNVIHDDVFNYALPDDFGKLIDLYPQSDRRPLSDNSQRQLAKRFDLRKSLADKTISIEASEGSKILRVNWRNRQGKVLHNCDNVTTNGTWEGVTNVVSVVQDTITKLSGAGSLRFSMTGSGGSIRNITARPIDLTNENGVGDVFLWLYLPSTTAISYIYFALGNDTSTNYFAFPNQTTQADGSALKIGWNLLKFSWSAATENGSVDVSTINSFLVYVNTTDIIPNIRLDNIICSIGRNFDIKYYSKYIFKSTAGVLMSRFTSDDDTVILDNDAIELWKLENLIQAAQQTEGTDSLFDLTWAKKELLGEDMTDRNGAYARYRAQYPSLIKKAVNTYGNLPARGRW